MNKMLEFLDELEKRKIYYRLNKVRDSVMVEIAVPGQRWEVEFMSNGDIQIEKFISEGKIYDESEINTLFKCFSN